MSKAEDLLNSLSDEEIMLYSTAVGEEGHIIIGSDRTVTVPDELKKIVSYLHQEEQVEFLGWLENPWAYCKDASALVAASEYEGFQLSAAEALSMGMTVISTPVEGVIDYVQPGVNGYFFKQEDAIGLAQILDMIYEGKLSLCDRNVCRNSVKKFSVENYFSNVSSILEKICGSSD